MKNIPTIQLDIESIGGDCTLPLDEGRAWLSGAEIERADRFHFDLHRERFIRGRALLRSKLAARLNQKPEQVVLLNEKLGKPYIPCRSVTFNLSHTEDVATYALSEDLELIGVDIEKVDRKADTEGLCKHYFTEGERAVMAGLEPGLRKVMFFKIWTSKEARMKISGDGLHLDPRKIDLKFTQGLPTGYLAPEPREYPLMIREYLEFKAIVALTADREFKVS